VTTDKVNYEELYKAEFAEKQKCKSIIRTLYTDSPDMLWIKDLAGRYVWGNSRVITGLLGKKCLDDIIGFTDLEIAKDLAVGTTAGISCTGTDKITVLKGTKQLLLEEFILNGEFTVLEVIKNVIRDGNGDIVGTTGAGRDITKNYQLLHELVSGIKCEGMYGNPLELVYDSVHKIDRSCE